MALRVIVKKRIGVASEPNSVSASVAAIVLKGRIRGRTRARCAFCPAALGRRKRHACLKSLSDEKQPLRWQFEPKQSMKNRFPTQAALAA
jgi:hypothetical protein